jgi:site-specific recombinase XerD
VSINLFLESIRSKETKSNYELLFNKYVEFVDTVDLFFGNDPKLIESKIIEFILHLKNKGKSYSAISNYVAPIKAFYKLNDFVLNDRKISRFMPEQMKRKKDRGYTHQEISKLLEIADERMRVVILVLASSGIRLGALPLIRLKNLEDNKILTIYENHNQEYFTFITPECAKAISDYLNMRSRYGEKLDDASYLIREQFDIRDQFAIRNPKQIRTSSIEWNLITLAERCGIRNRKHEKNVRHEVKIAHGFRKFFTNQLIEADVKTEYRWLMEGHNLKANDEYYVRIHEQKLYEEYEKAIDNLTIDPSNRLQRKVEMLTIEKSRLDRIEEKMLKMEQMYQK